jgi:hypothetical protein
MDTLTRDKRFKTEHSEAFQHLILLTLLRLWEHGKIGMAA